MHIHIVHVHVHASVMSRQSAMGPGGGGPGPELLYAQAAPSLDSTEAMVRLSLHRDASLPRSDARTSQ